MNDHIPTKCELQKATAELLIPSWGEDNRSVKVLIHGGENMDEVFFLLLISFLPLTCPQEA